MNINTISSLIAGGGLNGLAGFAVLMVALIVIPIPGAILAHMIGVAGRGEARTAVRSLEELDTAFKSDRVSLVQFGSRYQATSRTVSRACVELSDKEICEGLRTVRDAYRVTKSGWKTRRIPEETYRQLTTIKVKLGGL